MSIWTDQLNAIYDSPIGTDATVDLLPSVTFRAVDKTSGVDLQMLGKASVQTIVPAVCLRRYELDANGVTPASILNSVWTFNGANWKVINTAYRAQPGGEMEGELWLILRATS